MDSTHTTTTVYNLCFTQACYCWEKLWKLRYPRNQAFCIFLSRSSSHSTVQKRVINYCFILRTHGKRCATIDHSILRHSSIHFISFSNRFIVRTTDLVGRLLHLSALDNGSRRYSSSFYRLLDASCRRIFLCFFVLHDFQCISPLFPKHQTASMEDEETRRLLLER